MSEYLPVYNAGTATITDCRPTHVIVKKRHRTQTATTQLKLSSQLSLALSKMIAQLERTPITTPQNKDQMQTKHTLGMGTTTYNEKTKKKSLPWNA